MTALSKLTAAAAGEKKPEEKVEEKIVDVEAGAPPRKPKVYIELPEDATVIASFSIRLPETLRYLTSREEASRRRNRIPPRRARLVVAFMLMMLVLGDIGLFYLANDPSEGGKMSRMQGFIVAGTLLQLMHFGSLYLGFVENLKVQRFALWLAHLQVALLMTLAIVVPVVAGCYVSSGVNNEPIANATVAQLRVQSANNFGEGICYAFFIQFLFVMMCAMFSWQIGTIRQIVRDTERRMYRKRAAAAAAAAAAASGASGAKDGAKETSSPEEKTQLIETA